MTGLHIGTVAMSIHNAIFKTDRPMSSGELQLYLAREWHDDIDLVEIEAAIQEMIARGRLGRVAEIEGASLYDILLKDSKGKRARAPKRIRDPRSPHHGWF